jgi:serine/threonine-protein kinase ULK/ATG1
VLSCALQEFNKLKYLYVWYSWVGSLGWNCKAPNRIYLVLEYCAGGDLAAYIQRYGKVSEGTARHFMQQLGAGLQVLRNNNLIHRDLKPQNLLLSTNDSTAVLKIADFGFARLLQPQGMAETLCGSPLYMAPEILQSKKYDAKVFPSFHVLLHDGVIPCD